MNNDIGSSDLFLPQPTGTPPGGEYTNFILAKD